MSAEPLDASALRMARVVLVGYAGRDQEAVRAHVEELERHGVPAPTAVPAVWEVPSALLTQDAAIRVGRETSGEVEPVIVLNGDDALLAVGSDHTDRGLERSSMDDAKRANPKIVSKDAWSLPTDAEWDRLLLRSTIEVDGAWQTYQEAPLSTLLPPSWYVERFGGNGPVVIFCGTVATVGDLETRATAFRAELIDAQANRTLCCEYRIDTA